MPKFIDLDFSNTSDRTPVPDGTYVAEVVEVTEEESQAGNDYLKWKWRTLEPVAGGTVYDNTSLLPQSLWKLRGILTALGMEVPTGRYKFDPREARGLRCQIVVVGEEWEGRVRPKINEYFLLPSDTPARSETKPARGATKSKRRKPAQPEGPQVGDEVWFDDEGETYNGKITAIDGSTVTVKTAEGEEWDLDASDILTESPD